jgi:methionyl-tRNA formyltransferase
MEPLYIPRLEFVALLGASAVFDDLIPWLGVNGVRTAVVTAPDQAEAVAHHDPIVAERLTPALKPQLKGLTLGISFGARWIVKEPLRRCLFHDCLLNCHGTRLPFDRGGGTWSYRAMRNERLGNLLLHQVDDGIDTGPVLAAHEYVIPRHRQTPAEIYDDYCARLYPFLVAFLMPALKGPVFVPRLCAPPYMGSYLPRLSTAEHGAIDWQSDPYELERFILAFDAPYAGAHSTLNGVPVHLKNCQLSAGDVRTADWQSGTVLRRGNGFLVVALRNGWTLIVETVTDASGKPVAVRDGDVFGAPSRVAIGPNGVVRANAPTKRTPTRA